jgi:hypothetical protein
MPVRVHRGRQGRGATTVIVALALLLVAACGSTTPSSSAADPGDGSLPAPSSETSGTADDSATTTTTVREPTGGVVLAGDSMMSELSAVLIEALATQQPPAIYVAQPNLAAYPTLLPEWQGLIDRLDPKVVVVLVGTWERIVVDTTVPAWQEAYLADVIDPFVELVTSRGASLVVLSYPPLADQPDVLGAGGLNDLFASLPERNPAVSFVDAGGALRGADGGFVPTVPVPGVGELLIRQSDGRHLCPDGAMLMADPVLTHLAEAEGIAPVEGWQRGVWRSTPENFEHPELCPGAF